MGGPLNFLEEGSDLRRLICHGTQDKLVCMEQRGRLSSWITIAWMWNDKKWTRVLVVDVEMRDTNWEGICDGDLHCAWNSEWNEICEGRRNVMEKELRCNKEMDVLNNSLQYQTCLKRVMENVPIEGLGKLLTSYLHNNRNTGWLLVCYQNHHWGRLTLTTSLSLNLSSRLLSSISPKPESQKQTKKQLSDLWDAI